MPSSYPIAIVSVPFILGAILAGCGSGAGPATASTPAPTPSMPLPGYQLVWQDEFEGSALDPAKWNLRTGKRRDALNGAEAVSVRNGLLTLSTFTQDGVHHTGFLDTEGKLEPTYGFMEARIRFFPASGTWGAFWLEAPTMGTPLGDPATAGTEMDVVEHRAVDASGRDVSQSFASTLHWDGYGADHKKASSGLLPLPGPQPLPGQWHTFGLLWTRQACTFCVDGIPQWSSSSAVSRRSEYLLLTCEVENATWAGPVPPQGYGALGSGTARMEVDWVRVWQKP